MWEGIVLHSLFRCILVLTGQLPYCNIIHHYDKSSIGPDQEGSKDFKKRQGVCCPTPLVP